MDRKKISDTVPKPLKYLIEILILFCVGGSAYIIIEMVSRGYSHWSMFIVGGLCFLIVGAINNFIGWDFPVEYQCLIGAVAVTIIEFISGYIINIKLGWDVWDYSNMPFNVMGQICLPFTILWIFVSLLAILVDDQVRYRVFGEEVPRYYSIILKKTFTLESKRVK